MSILSTGHEAQLQADKKVQLIRLVNPRDIPLKFQFKQIQTNGLSITPSSGTIGPRDFKIIHVEIEKLIDDKINLIYWADGLKSYNNRSVPIKFVGKSESKEANPKFVWSVVLVVRSIFLLALLAYNLMLIRTVSIKCYS